MHPVLWGCNQVMNQFTSYVRWKLKSAKARFIPYNSATTNGSLMMAFTSCIQDGGPDGNAMQLRSAMMDIPGSINVSLGIPSVNKNVAKMTFVDGLDWKFTCRSGFDVNEMYCGALIVALTADSALYRALGGNVYLGTIQLEYEIALAEPASTLSLVRPRPKINFKQSQVGSNQPLQVIIDQNTAKAGDIMALPWYPPTEVDSHNNIMNFASASGGNATPPVPGQTVYLRAQSDTGLGQFSGNLIGTFFPSLAAAMKASDNPNDLNNFNLKNISPTTTFTPDSSWITAGLGLAKVILPSLIDTAATILL